MHHHWVPDSYLQAWIDPVRPDGHEPFVHLFNKKGGSHKRKSPGNILKMPELYTFLEDGAPNRSIEGHFSRLEHDFVRVRKIIEQGGSGGAAEVAALYGFVAAMMVRPVSSIDFHRKQYERMAAWARGIKIRPGTKPMPSLNTEGPKMTISDVQRMADDPMGTWFPAALNVHIEALFGMFQCDILVNGSPHPFLTSDRPATTYFNVPDSARNIPRGLGHPACEITMPLSPRYALRFTHGSPGVGDRWPVLDWRDVFEINFLTITRADKIIVSDQADLYFVQTILNRVAEVEESTARGNHDVPD